jgi:hypothetical protein
MLVILTSLALAGASVEPPPNWSSFVLLSSVGCRYSTAKIASWRPSPPTLRRLGDLPDANEEILVNRTVNGCPAAVTVVHNVSGARR